MICMSSPSRHLGLDLGGTNIKLTVIEIHAGSEPRVVAASSVPTVADDGPDAVTAKMVAAGRAFATEHGPVSTVGVGIPGLFNPDTERIKLFTNLQGSSPGFPVRDRVAHRLGLPTMIINDARAFVLAEAELDAGRGSRTLVGLTLGTGIGGGVIIRSAPPSRDDRHGRRDRPSNGRSRGPNVRLREPRLRGGLRSGRHDRPARRSSDG